MKWYFTFGSDDRFPYGRDDYVLVYADSRKEACEKFKAKYPNRPETNCINCACIYDEDEWERLCRQFYVGVEPIEVMGREGAKANGWDNPERSED